MQDYLQKLVDSQFNALADDVRFIVVHPHYGEAYHIRNRYLSSPCLYFSLQGDKLNLSQLKAQWDTQRNSKYPNDDEETKTIILDECDRAKHKALSGFLRYILQHYPHSRIILFGRDINPAMLGGYAQQTVFIPHHESTMLYDYASLPTSPHHLEVRTLGEGRVYLDGRLITKWDGQLPRALFFYLVDKGIATRSDIFKTFWEKMTPREATNIFHVTKGKINDILGFDLTVYESGFYRLSPQINIYYDAVVFRELIQQSQFSVSSQHVEQLLGYATHLHQGPFLKSLDMQWVKDKREEISQDYSEALLKLASMEIEHQNYAKALGILSRVASTGHQREEFVEKMMQVYLGMNQPEQALIVYNHFCEDLRQTKNTQPNQTLQALVAKIMA